MSCPRCGGPLSTAEASAYNGRCEECWTAGEWVNGWPHSPARCYTSEAVVEDVTEVTNQLDYSPVTKHYQRRRRDHS